MTSILCVIFFLSGASALIFEMLWFHLSGLVFGNSVWATSIVLCSFMGGLALGNGLSAFWGHKIRSPLSFYACLEIIIAVSGFSLVFVLPGLTEFFAPLFRTFLGHGLLLNSLRAVVAMILMVIPASAMGATLPVLVKALYSEQPNFGRVLGILYGWNTLGAMVGVITCEIFLIEWLGIRGAGLVAASFNLSGAAMALWLSNRHIGAGAGLIHTSPLRGIREVIAPPPFRPNESNKPRVIGKSNRPPAFRGLSLRMALLLIASFLCGFSLLALEVIWFRFMTLFFVAHSLNFAVMLAVVLAGISSGGLFASKLYRLGCEAHRYLAPVLFLNGLFIVLIYSNFSLPLDWFSDFSAEVYILFASLFLILPVSFVSGSSFTMIGRALGTEIKAATQATGLLTLANTTGGMFGALAGLVLVPWIGIEGSFFLFALVYGALAFLVSDKGQNARLGGKTSFYFLFGGAFLFALIIFPFGLMDNRYLEIPLKYYSKDKTHRRVAVREGLTETIQYIQKDILGEPYYHLLVTNSCSMSSTTKGSKRYTKLFAYWPVALHPDPKAALLIAFGCGSTAKALTDTKGLNNIVIVDTSKDILEMSSIVFPNARENPINDPRVKIHIEDGRFFLLTTERRFDLITAEPPPPKLNGIVNLYTQEYFQLIHDRLSERGIVTYWLPVYQLKVQETKSILKGFCNVFEHCSLWTGAGFEWMMVGIRDPDGPISERDFVRQWNDPFVGPEMRALGFEAPEQFGSIFVADGKRLRDWISGSLPLVDNYPRRLSCGNYGGDMYLLQYSSFMDPAVSRVNFMKSEMITKLWPEVLREKTEKYFAVRQTINEMLGPKSLTTVHPIMNLHACIHNPLLTEYILWAFGRDQYVQRIIFNRLKSTSDKSPEIYIDLAAGAAQQHDYLVAEAYLHSAKEKLCAGNSLEEYRDIALFRMYLLFISGCKMRAEEVGREYINLKETGKPERRKQIATFWGWMVRVIEKKD
ncbi:MAG: spermidine synthase [Thermodesulfobacteriota bacterium]|nr:spermidine synthase [Thermodesulfobacteriota bacterium]